MGLIAQSPWQPVKLPKSACQHTADMAYLGYKDARVAFGRAVAEALDIGAEHLTAEEADNFRVLADELFTDTFFAPYESEADRAGIDGSDLIRRANDDALRPEEARAIKAWHDAYQRKSRARTQKAAEEAVTIHAAQMMAAPIAAGMQAFQPARSDKGGL